MQQLTSRQDAVASAAAHPLALPTKFSVCAHFWYTLMLGAANSPPEMGKFVHDVEGEMFCESINTKIPYFNAPIYLENKVHAPASHHPRHAS
jgi:hypothetical protein